MVHQEMFQRRPMGQGFEQICYRGEGSRMFWDCGFNLYFQARHQQLSATIYFWATYSYYSSIGSD